MSCNFSIDLMLPDELLALRSAHPQTEMGTTNLSSIQPRSGRRGEGSMEGMEVGGEVPPPL
jgi:hypothetical protein